MDVGVRELKEHLSEYLERAAAGEVIRVTDHGRPKAILAPLPGVSNLNAGVEAGWIAAPPSAHAPVSTPRIRSEETIADALGEDRGV